MTDEEKLQFEYEQVLTHWRGLADIRFKLLAIVPALAGAAVAIGSNNRPPGVEIALGLVGFFATTGIVFYDQRNTQLYNDAMARAKWLEEQLGFSSHKQTGKPGGLFLTRPVRQLKLFGVLLMWHDRGLSIVYSTALASWVFLAVHGLITSSLLARFLILQRHALGLSVIAALGAGILIYKDLMAKDVDVDRAHKASAETPRGHTGPQK